jgi:hypothetical protein
MTATRRHRGHRDRRRDDGHTTHGPVGDPARDRPTLFTPAFAMLAFASLAYFTGAGILIPALPRYVEGPLGGGNVAVGLTFGAFSVSAVLLRPWAGGSATGAGGGR